MEALVKNEVVKQRFYSDFGGLRIKESGLRLGDRICVSPFNGSKQEVLLNRISYDLQRGTNFHHNGSKSLIEIPFVSKEKTSYKLILCGKDSRSPMHEEGRYLLLSTGDNPFKLNGNYVFEAFLEYGDVVELEYSRLEVKEKSKALNKNFDFKLEKKIIESKLSILIEGETGTGKSRLAKAVHDKSLRSGPFVQINISSFSEGLLESELFGHIKGAFTGAVNSKQGAFAEANRGTLFIDEIDSLPLGIQTKLLLFLDNKKVRPVGAEREMQLDVRLIFSSGKNLKELVSSESMRQDFFYRLTTGGRIKLHPLRNNKTMITEIIKEFEATEGVFVTPNLKQFYRRYPWPGNVRQLLGHLNQKLVLSGGAKLDFCSRDEDLESNIFTEKVLDFSGEIKTLDEVKNLYVKKTFEKLDGNIKRTARLLSISPNTVRNVIRS